MKWLIHAARNRPGPASVKMPTRLAAEVMDLYHNQVEREVGVEAILTFLLRWNLYKRFLKIKEPPFRRFSVLLPAFLSFGALQGTVIKRKQDLHRLAESNRAFAHYRW